MSDNIEIEYDDIDDDDGITPDGRAENETSLPMMQEDNDSYSAFSEFFANAGNGHF